MATRSRAWVFTYNNYTEESIQQIQKIKEQAVYLIYGKEIAPTTGTHHIQGYTYFKEAKSFKTMQKIMPPGTHLEAAKGNALENKKYCSKENNYEEFGEIPSQGKRNDIELIREQINEGRGMREIVETATSYQSIRTAEIILKYKEKKRNWKPEVIWIYGESGTGKTRMVYEKEPEIYRKTNSTGKWFDGYDAHEAVLIDDVKDTTREYYSLLLELLDRYDVQIECKGGSRQFLAKRIYVTSLWHPSALYDKFHEAKEILRRIDQVIELNGAKQGEAEEQRDEDYAR